MAVDGPGVRKVLDAAKVAKEKNLSLVSGFCFRYHFPKQALYQRVLDGQIGDVKILTSTRNGGGLWYKPRQPEWSDMEYHMRNWYYYNWLSGDFIVEMFVHSLDMISWAMGDKVPVRATGSGGRQARVEPKFGNIYDHFATEYEYENGAKAYTFTRQQDGASTENSLEIFGTKGNAFYEGNKHLITGENSWQYDGESNDMYQTEHDVLFSSIREGKAINDGERAANSSMMGILGRMVAYSGQTITWEEAMNSEKSLGPQKYNWDLNFKGPDIAVPGVTKVLV
ncbi:Gfo/Idh/MocA family oxidoreductase [Antarcticibacterium sp. 1MA-6-2]|uniref:Gfo/Idh/MocA family protein n=1 Tax=Antarcticibacterium sp. 1MA-6-2 TaxID=2908210 RepID=UPI001F15ABBD|nr:Gfo/Idh/MocA family oxidoreductase [Antarcticibacterium sp. 1MA-6-2]UJH90169.1 Gfo/Idh/MocA family oxidoreductase [Antarcticibacterium sp. 1MA-6-2]